MLWRGNLRKLGIESGACDDSILQYHLNGAEVLTPLPPLPLNDLLGRNLILRFSGNINCVATGKKIKRTFGDGLSFDAWQKAPQAVESVIRPELSRIHEGIALRDRQWEIENHLVPHWLYLAQTSTIKVGVTGEHTGAKRWYDQGAIAGTVICIAPYRGMAGEMEVLLKDYFDDKSAYRGMLMANEPDVEALEAAREEAFEALGTAFEDFMIFEGNIRTMRYPMMHTPKSIQSVRLDKHPTIEGQLVGLKGQYFVFEDGRALNVRSHIGYEVEIQFN